MGNKVDQGTYFIRDTSDIPDCCYTCVWLGYVEGQDQDYCDGSYGGLFGVCKNFTRESLDNKEEQRHE